MIVDCLGEPDYHDRVGIAALAVGILGALLALHPLLFYVSLPLGVVSLVLGVIARKAAIAKKAPSGMPTAGMVLGIVTVCISGTMWLLCAVIWGSITNKTVRDHVAKPLAEGAFAVGEKALDKAAEAARARPVPLDPAHAIAVTARKLEDDFAADAAAAEARYKGKTLEVTGTVAESDMDPEEPFVRFQGSWQEDLRALRNSQGDLPAIEKMTFGIGAICYLAPGAASRLGSLKEGQKVTLLGRCDGELAGVQLTGCVPVTR
jgi:hypothetical protein